MVYALENHGTRMQTRQTLHTVARPLVHCQVALDRDFYSWKGQEANGTDRQRGYGALGGDQGVEVPFEYRGAPST